MAEVMQQLDNNTEEGALVLESMTSFLSNVNELETQSHGGDSSSSSLALASPTVAQKLSIISALLDIGQPVVIENIGVRKTITDCTPQTASTLFRRNVEARDASVVGMRGCLVYNRLNTVLNLNNPLFVPDNTPEFFKMVASESGVISALAAQASGWKSYSVDKIINLLFSRLGYSPYQEDDNGVVLQASVTSKGLKPFLELILHQLKTGELNLERLKSYRFHTGYNPTGGWEINLAADLGTVPAACVDSTPLSECPILPLRYHFDGVNLTANPNGPYVLRMEYRGGQFQDFGWIVDYNTSRPYRDSYFHPVQVPIHAADYSAIDSINHLYDKTLDPMIDAQGNSVPFSNSVWRAAYPGMRLVDNAYLFPTPEFASRILYLLGNSMHVDRLSGWHAFSVVLMLTEAMAALPVENGGYAFLGDSGKTPAQWDHIVADWLNTQSRNTFRWQGGASMKIEEDGAVTIGMNDIRNNKCQAFSENRVIENCVWSTSNFKVDRSSAQVTGKGTRFKVTGSLTATSRNYKTTFTPTSLLVDPQQAVGLFQGDDGLVIILRGQKILSSGLSSGRVIQSGFTFGAMTE